MHATIIQLEIENNCVSCNCMCEIKCVKQYCACRSCSKCTVRRYNQRTRMSKTALRIEDRCSDRLAPAASPDWLYDAILEPVRTQPSSSSRAIPCLQKCFSKDFSTSRIDPIFINRIIVIIICIAINIIGRISL